MWYNRDRVVWKMISTKKNVTLYHGSVYRVEKPKLLPLDSQKDFGQGFYLTTDRQQALNFAKNKMITLGKSAGYINQYYIDSFDGLNILEFESADINWLKFIRKNQIMATTYNYDVVIGKIADDNTRTTLRDYIMHRYDREAQLRGITAEEVAIERLLPDRLKNQICMHTQIAIDKLKFVKASVIR